MGKQYIDAGASFSPDRVYRYRLWRAWGDGPRVLWIMLNPSTADETQLDPTLRRCEGFSKRWGFDGFEVANLYAFRATDPRDLMAAGWPCGAYNDATIARLTNECPLVVVGWGTRAQTDRACRVGAGLRNPKCLGVTKDGHPRHPLYVPAATALQPYRGRHA